MSHKWVPGSARLECSAVGPEALGGGEGARTATSQRVLTQSPQRIAGKLQNLNPVI